MKILDKILIGLGLAIALAAIIFGLIQMGRANKWASDYSKLEQQQAEQERARQSELKLVVFGRGKVDSIFRDGRTITHSLPPETQITMKPSHVDTLRDSVEVKKYFIWKGNRWVEVSEKTYKSYKGDPVQVKVETKWQTRDSLVYSPERSYASKAGFLFLPQLCGGVLLTDPIKGDFGLRAEWAFWQPIEHVVLNAGTCATKEGFTPLDGGIRMPVFTNLHLTAGATKSWKDFIKLKQGWSAKAAFAVDLR